MTSASARILLQRLRNQRLAGSSLRTPLEVVAWLGAVQAQDYPAARWAVGQRTATLSDAAVRQAVDEGAILRTHVLRPTWHFVAPEDIRWMLELTAPRVKAACALYHREAGLTARIIAKSQLVIARELEGGRQLTRSELGAALARKGIDARGTTLGHVMLQAELDAIVCSGAARGKHSTYALIAARAPQAPRLHREEALATLARRYFQSHGPALAVDFAWWSGLTVADAKAGIAMATPALDRLSLDGRDYWHVDAPVTRPTPAAYLLPNFDEYVVAYRDRGLVVGMTDEGAAAMTPMEALGYVIVIDGRIAGTWKRATAGDAVSIEVRPHRKLTQSESRLVGRAAERYGAFVGTRVKLSTAPASGRRPGSVRPDGERPT